MGTPFVEIIAIDVESGGEMSIRGLTKRFGTVPALTDASFDVRAGEVLGLIGPNGSGKSTLFQCVAGTMPADSGSVLVKADPLTSVRTAPLSIEARRDALYFMPDGIRPWPGQTVAWMLGFLGDLARRNRVDRAEVIELLGIERLLKSRIGTLSKGEHKRVLLAAALLSRQPILMLDEPFDGLDLRQVQDAMTALRRAASYGRTLFLSIHQLGDAAKICERFVLLSGGRVVGEGTLRELRTKAKSDAASLDEIFLALT